MIPKGLPCDLVQLNPCCYLIRCNGMSAYGFLLPTLALLRIENFF
jgi:hypothetical protein